MSDLKYSFHNDPMPWVKKDTHSPTARVVLHLQALTLIVTLINRVKP